ncbi:hypothetical protein RND81_03G037500 [Saponaria officinalis]|uniref:Late embryogenesis abundant protein LEA-2 subgroup domain-containing protein n=1 Tax=Saponaria officinalis TaxID=3572 RepID=A0AAW1LYI4_SAPOF
MAVKDQAQFTAPKNPTRITKPTRRCCSLLCLLGTLLTITTLIIILILTVFKVKNPIMTINKIQLGTGKTSCLDFVPGSNITMTIDASVKNPNVGGYNFSNTTSSIFYDGIMVGRAYGPPGRVPARRSIRMNIRVEIVAASLLNAPNLITDLGSGVFTMDSYTRTPGIVKLIVVKKSVVVEMNCTVTFNITSQEIRHQQCKSRVDFF